MRASAFPGGKGGGLLREAFCVKPFPRKEQVSAGGWYNDFRVAAGMILPGQKLRCAQTPEEVIAARRTAI